MPYITGGGDPESAKPVDAAAAEGSLVASPPAPPTSGKKASERKGGVGTKYEGLE